MAKLIALMKPQSNSVVAEILEIWNRGDAVSILDPNLPLPYLEKILDTLDPDVIIDSANTKIQRTPKYDLPSNAALVITTSGTSGTPKAVVHTHDSLHASAIATSKALNITPKQGKWINALPLSHIGGFSTITKAHFLGLNLEIIGRFDTQLIYELARDQLTYMPIVRANLANLDTKLFAGLVIGGGKPPRAIPTNAYVTYGLTETGSGCVYNGAPIDGVSIKICANGEILIKGPVLAASYRNNEPLVDADNYFHTGDLGEFGDSGLIVFGRASDVINSGGEMILPNQVEEIILTMPQVAEVAVIGLKDIHYGEKAWAVVVVNQSNQSLSLQEIKERVREELPHFHAPRGLSIVESLPKTPLGKISRVQLAKTLNSMIKGDTPG